MSATIAPVNTFLLHSFPVRDLPVGPEARSPHHPLPPEGKPRVSPSHGILHIQAGV